MQSFADLSTTLSARDCSHYGGKILPMPNPVLRLSVPRSAVDLFSLNLSALVKNHQQAHPELTLVGLAKKMGVAPRTLSNARGGAHAATLETVQAVANFFKLDVWQLFMEDLTAEILLSPSMARMVRRVVKATVTEAIEQADESLAS